MYHDISNFVKPFFSRMFTGRKVDKLRPLAYSVEPGQEPVRHCFRNEAKEMRPDARLQVRKTGDVFTEIH